jgi:hypothetical protein
MVMIAQHRRRVDVVVHDDPQLAAGLQPHRLHVDALVGQQAADARQRPGTVAEAQRKFNPDHGERVSEVRGVRCGADD